MNLWYLNLDNLNFNNYLSKISSHKNFVILNDIFYVV